MSDDKFAHIGEAEQTRAVDALKKHLNPKDEMQFFDPYLSVVSPPARHPRMSGGYKLWPLEEPETPADVRLMTIGNSTSLWPYYPWSLELGELLTTDQRSIEVWHGAGKGNTSSQELMRVLRDAPVIKPDLIVSLSGICDIGYLLNDAKHPHLHKYARRVLDFAVDAGVVTRNLFFGPADDASPAQVWCRNQRFARVLADEQGVRLMTFLQPVQGYGSYTQTDEEKALFAQKAKVVLRAAEKPYGECVTEFYTEVKAIMAARPADFDHVIDFTEAFADCTEAYKDHRHQSPKGVTHLAKKMHSIVDQAINERRDR